MPFLPAPAAEPRHPRGGAGGAGLGQDLPPWHWQKVKVPLRVWGQGRYTPGAVAYWAQIAALAQRADGCRASVETLAGYLGDAKRTAERYLAELAAPGPDGEPEVTTVRHTAADGDGETAERRTRACKRGEHFAYVPVLAVKTLRRPLFVAYCALTYAVATRTPVTAAELASLLGVTERSARRMIRELEALGWITVHHRAGAHGRHEFDVHDHPLRLVDEPNGPDAGPDTDGGSAADTNGGSLASKEDPGLTDASSTHRRGAFRRRRGDREWGPAPVDTHGNQVADTFRPASVATVADPTAAPGRRTPVRPAGGRSYDGPALTLSRRVWAVLAPVHDLLPGCTTFTVRRIAREIGRQLDTGIWPEDIRDQITRLRAWTPPENLTDPGRWLLGAVLPVRSRCGTTGCHWGFLTHTGAPCKACAELDADRHRGAHPPHTGRPRPYACTTCHWPSTTPLPHGRCAACRTA
ncbi:HTH domain-containing protein [Streptomyces longwoodensis]|uniref:HTH domain-containing protein n=1 Tax=Streptomyces longwoodensis TaxID=68231 RepID=UPI0033E8D5FA